MSRRYGVYQVDAFTTQRFAGNPAGVVPDAAGLSEAEMLAIARELNNSETAFVLPAEHDDHDVRVRFFTPTTEVPICGHATIAAHWIRAHEGAPQGITRQRTGAGILPVEIEIDVDGRRRIWMTQAPALFAPAIEGEARDALLAALGIGPDAVADYGPIQVVSTGHSKVLIPLRSRAALDGLKPDLKALVRLSSQFECNGYYPFTLASPAPGFLSHGRMFAPAIGIPEDPVTGNASGPLGAYLLEHGHIELDSVGKFTFEACQGEAMGRQGSVTVEVTRSDAADAIQVRIAGEAVIVFRTEIELNA
ncbi:MAG TPA: PhzF family phenazine biosynthesis isomerase [Steroidobacter sp.]